MEASRRSIPLFQKQFCRIYVFALLASACLAGAYAQEQGAAAVEVIQFTPPVADGQRVSAVYPPAARRDRVEGYVEFSFTVDADGQVVDPTIIATTGYAGFESAALKALRASTFTPAMLDGEPIVGASTVRYVFRMEAPQAADRKFVAMYGNFDKALAGGDREKAEAALAELEDVGASTHYEHAYLYMARYKHALQFGSVREQMDNLHGALSYANSPDDEVHMPAEELPALWRSLFALQVKNNFFAAALDSWAIMEANGDQEGLELLAEVVEAINTAKADDTEFAVPLVMGKSGYLSHSLLKRNFFISGGEGEVTQAAFYCDKRYSSMLVERNVDYAIPEAWGNCAVRLAGEAGANFYLVQH